MNDKPDKTRPYKISENARKAKLNFLNSNVRPSYTTIWETITIEESLSEGGNTFVKERIPFDLGGEFTGRPIYDATGDQNEDINETVSNYEQNYERPPDFKSASNEREQQRPSTTDLMFDSSRPSTSNDQFPASTKSLSPKHLSRVAVLNEHSLRSSLNRNVEFKLDDAEILDNFGDRTSEDRSQDKGDEIGLNYGVGLIDDGFDKFKNNRSLNPTDRQLEKWKAIKRFKTLYRMNDELMDSGRPTGPEANLSEQNWPDQNLDSNLFGRSPAVDQQQAASEQAVQPFDRHRIQQSPIESPSSYKRATPEANDPNLFDSSSEQSGEQIPIEISDYYGSLDSNTRLSDKEEEFDDNLVNFEVNLESDPEDAPEKADSDRRQQRPDFHLVKQRKTEFQQDLENQIKLRNQRIQQSSQRDQTDFSKPSPASPDGLSEQRIRIDLETDHEYTPRASTVVSELNEHNFIDLDDHPLDYEQCLTQSASNPPDNPPNILVHSSDYTSNTRSNQPTNDKPPTDANIEQEFDKLFLDYPEIDKFLNPINSPTNSASNDVFVNIQSPANSPIRSPISLPIKSPYLTQNPQNRNQPSYGEPLNRPVKKPFPSEVLEIEEPLIISRNSSRLQNSPNISQSVKRRSVVVQTSRPTSLMTNDGDEEIKHLLTITKNDKLTHCYPVKDVYVVNRTVYQIQKLSSFVLEFRNLLALIRGKLKRRAFPMDENQEDQPTEKAKEESKWTSIKLILKWTVANLFTTPGLAFILVCYCLIGAFLFKILERDNNLREIKQMTQYR